MSLSKFAVYSLKRKFLDNLVSAIKFVILTNESIDEAGRAQLVTYVCYVDSITLDLKEECISSRKLGSAKQLKCPKP